MNRAVKEAERVAAMLRRSGYPDASPAPHYCINGEIGMDNFFTYTVSVYAGEKQAVPPPWRTSILSSWRR